MLAECFVSHQVEEVVDDDRLFAWGRVEMMVEALKVCCRPRSKNSEIKFVSKYTTSVGEGMPRPFVIGHNVGAGRRGHHYTLAVVHTKISSADRL